MFDGKGSSKSESKDAIKFTDELYNTLLKDTLESSNNMWKVEHYLKTLWKNDDCYQGIYNLVLLQQLSGRLEQTGPILSCMDANFI